jgi:hypothetical protein
VMGSPYYMSPEQVQSARDVDPRSDIWALGVILYELVAGRVPFDGETIAQLVLKIMTAPFPPLRDFRPDAPEGLQAAILRCLEKDRARRYQNVAELAVALAEFGPKRARPLVERITRVIQAAGMSASALALPPSSDMGSRPGAAGTLAPMGRTTAGLRGGKKTLAVVAAVGVLMLAGIAAFAMLAKRNARPAEPAALVAGVPLPSAAKIETAPTSAPVVQAEPPAVVPAVAMSAAHRVTVGGARTAQDATKKAVAAKPPSSAAAGPPAVPVKPPFPKPNCDPNFYLDAQGEKHFKPECF